MTDPYETLGVTVEADDVAIRQRYLELAREFPPEQHPARFAAIRAAYEAIKTLEARATYRLLDSGREDTIESIIDDAMIQMPRRRAGLNTLIATMYTSQK